MKAKELKRKIRALVLKNYQSSTSSPKSIEFDVFTQFPELKDVIIDLLTSDYMYFISSIDWVAPRPTTFKINLKNNFNINLFLNEQCKDALNIMDFVNSLTIELADLERTGTHGFADGISNIFVKAIQNLDITKRPIHCTDLKRETLYIKENDERFETIY